MAGINGDLTHVMTRVRNVVGATIDSAELLGEVGARESALRGRLAPLGGQLHAIADLARDIEREIAAVYAETRTES